MKSPYHELACYVLGAAIIANAAYLLQAILLPLMSR
jgi:hypothetical protein